MGATLIAGLAWAAGQTGLKYGPDYFENIKIAMRQKLPGMDKVEFSLVKSRYDSKISGDRALDAALKSAPTPQKLWRCDFEARGWAGQGPVSFHAMGMGPVPIFICHKMNNAESACAPITELPDVR